MCDFQINGMLITKLRVVDLKEELEARGLSKSGKKDELIARLVSYLEANPEEGTSNSAVSEAAEDGDSRDEMMRKWQEEREQLLRENEERRLAEERKVKEEQERIAREEEERLAKEERELRKKEEQERLAKVQKEEEEKQKLNEEMERKRREEEERVLREQEAKRLKEKEIEDERLKKEKEIEEQKQKQLKKDEDERKKKKGEEEKIKKEEELKKIEAEKAEKEKAESAAAKVKEVPARGGMDASASKDEETLILETAADDTLVMEIEQADLVSEEPSKEEKEDLISAEPGQVTSLRKLGGSKTEAKDQRKRGWGASKSRDDSGSAVSISSNSLKDIVPDIAPLMDSKDPLVEHDEGETNSIESDPDVAGPKIPTAIKREEPVKKKKKITLTDDDNETNFLLITNLTRPFTVNALKEMLKRTGTIEDFWIDRIKSTCCVKFDTTDQASETRMALNGVAWPSGNPKSLKVTFTSEGEMKKYQEAGVEVGGKTGGLAERLPGVREWDRNKMSEEAGDARRDREDRRPEREVRMRERSSDRKPPLILEDLFKKTAASPAIYWRPLTELDIQRRIELRNKKMMEEKIRREMEDTKETIQKSNKLISSGSPP